MPLTVQEALPRILRHCSSSQPDSPGPPGNMSRSPTGWSCWKLGPCCRQCIWPLPHWVSKAARLAAETLTTLTASPELIITPKPAWANFCCQPRITYMLLALANLRFPSAPGESVRLAEQAIAQAASAGATIICFLECYVPGYRAPGKPVSPPDPAFLEQAWSAIAAAAGKESIGVVLGTERVVDGKL